MSNYEDVAVISQITGVNKEHLEISYNSDGYGSYRIIERDPWGNIDSDIILNAKQYDELIENMQKLKAHVKNMRTVKKLLLE